MGTEYKCAKKVFKRADISEVFVFFENDDFIVINGEEVFDISFNLYDKLIVDNCHGAFAPVAESGNIIIALDEKLIREEFDYFVWDAENYKVDSKKYIEKRICAGGIKCLRIHDKHSWHDTLYGTWTAKIEDDKLVICAMKNPLNEPSDSKQHTIMLHDITQPTIKKIALSFENFDGYVIYQDEIKDILLNFDDNLGWDSGGYVRKLKSGVLIFKLDKLNYRKIISCYIGEKIKYLERRVLGDFDICYFHIEYENYGYGKTRKECIEIDDMQDKECPQAETNDKDNDFDYEYISGYGERQKDGTIKLYFGESAKKHKENLGSCKTHN